MKQLFAFLICATFFFGLNAQNIFYITPSGAGTQSGASWNNAFDGKSLRSVLLSLDSSNVLWVAAGTYHPDSLAQDSSFKIAKGVKVYGGFPATGNPGWTDRNWITNPTILSGEIGDTTTTADNTWHLVRFNYVDSNTVLDGFTVTGANASGGNDNNNGGGIYVNAGTSGTMCSPNITNCTISNNAALGLGGGMYNNGTNGGTANPTITNCVFNNNSAGNNGGAICGYAQGSNGAISPIISRCQFISNHAVTDGGAVDNLVNYNAGNSYPQFINCVFVKNTAASGGAIANYLGGSSTGLFPFITNCTFSYDTATLSNNGSVLASNQTSGTCFTTVTNCIVWANNLPQESDNNSSATYTYCDVQLGYVGTGNINADPVFIQPSAGNFQIASCSPCINTGTATGAPNSDLNNNIRPSFGGYDMGAYQSQDTGLQNLTAIIIPVPGDTVCPGTNVSFNASTNLPVAGTYQWFLDGVALGIDSSTFSSSSFQSGAVVSCKITTTANCFASDTAQSHNITITVIPQPQAMFGYNASGSTYTFTDSSSGATSWLWYFGDGYSSTLPNPTHIYTAAGTYTVSEIASNNCGSDTITHSIQVVTGINNLTANVCVTLYPNPANSTLFINATNYVWSSVIIYDIQGRKINEQKFITKVNISSLPAGVYYLELHSNDSITRLPFIKE